MKNDLPLIYLLCRYPGLTLDEAVAILQRSQPPPDPQTCERPVSVATTQGQSDGRHTYTSAPAARNPSIVVDCAADSFPFSSFSSAKNTRSRQKVRSGYPAADFRE